MATVAELYEYAKKKLEDPDALDRDIVAALYITRLVDGIAKIVYEQQKADDPIKGADAGRWFKEENPNYSPFDGSSPYIYICPVCEFTVYKPMNYCPDCGRKMFPDEPLFKRRSK